MGHGDNHSVYLYFSSIPSVRYAVGCRARLPRKHRACCRTTTYGDVRERTMGRLALNALECTKQETMWNREGVTTMAFGYDVCASVPLAPHPAVLVVDDDSAFLH